MFAPSVELVVEELKAFAKVYLEPGQATGPLQLQPRDCTVICHEWVVEEDYDIWLPSGCGNCVVGWCMASPMAPASIKDWMNDEGTAGSDRTATEQLEMFMSSDSELAAMFSAMPIRN